MSPGDWYYSYLYLQFYHASDPTPGDYLSQWMNYFDYENGHANNPITLFAAGNTVVKNWSYHTGSVVVTFKVAGGGLLSSPYLQGTCINYENPDGTGARLSQYSFNSSASWQTDVLEGRVKMVGMAGICEVTAKATVNGSVTSFGDLAFEVIPGVEQDMDIDGPTLSVVYPEPDICSDVTSITVTGFVTDESGVESVEVNGHAATLTPTGNTEDPNEQSFSVIVPLGNGENIITTTATDALGKTATDSRTIVINSSDSDGDGVIDCLDNCLNVVNADQADVDEDGVGAACEECDEDPDKTEPGICGCGNIDFDTDGDGVLDCNDGCPNDPDKTAEGACGCGAPDVDSDNDEVFDCFDECPNDPEKIAEGACGCGVVDDGDNDGYNSCENDCNDNNPDINPAAAEECDQVDHNCNESIDDGLFAPYPDCLDLCPDDPNKTEPGICGCGIADDDYDEDGTPDCNDLCPEDPYKIDPGICDCGTTDDDSDGDGFVYCHDNCSDSPIGAIVDETGCGIDEICPCENNWKNHGAYVSCVARTSERFLASGLITEEEKDAIVSAAGQSDCGQK